ncbi:MAG: DNA methyltransferase [Candidatus Hodarchaeota archaeon]
MPLSLSDSLLPRLNSLQQSYQTIILNLANLLKQITDLHSLFYWNRLLEKLEPTGTCWVFVQDFYSPLEGKYVPRAFETLEVLAEAGFCIKNCIVRFKPDSLRNELFSQYYDNIIFCSRDQKSYQFDKDKIREPHIWKDAEWGGGRRSRYNPKGKDPSNFWIRTKSIQGKITGYYPLDDLEAIKRILLASCNTTDRVLLIHDNLNKRTVELLSDYAVIDFITLNWHPNNIENKRGYTTLDALPEPSKITEKEGLRNIKVFYKSSESMSELLSGSVKTTITSPPYWGLRDYNHINQIGYDESYKTYRQRLLRVWQECFRVLSPSGTLWINANKRLIEGQYLNIPYDCLRDVCNAGFTLINIVIWHRPISVPGYGEKNLADRYELILLFAKAPESCYLDKTGFQSKDYAPSFIGGMPNIWRLYRKIGNIGKTVRAMIKECGLKHTAMFPEELPRRAILLATKPNDIVLDPFLGSGTTLSVAKELGRRAIGYEINPDYQPIIEFRLKSKQMPLETFIHRKKVGKNQK